ncbi:MAG: hypothetical protein H7Y06_13970 [Opitutaceae bacterium]|nr:hypothetical protein [Opitutaceae bacterium]
MFEQAFKNIDDVLWKDAGFHGVFAALLLVTAISLTGCATPTKPAYRSPSPTEPVATVEGTKAPFGKFFSEGVAHVNLEEIDGQRLRSSFGNVVRSAKVAPGLRQVTVSFVGSGYVIGNATLPLEVVVAHTYKVEAVRNGSYFNVAVYDKDASGRDKRKVLSLQVAGSISELSNNPVPIYVPPR